MLNAKIVKNNIFAMGLFLFTAEAFALEDGEDILYGVKTSSHPHLQDFGTITPSDGNFTAIKQVEPSGTCAFTLACLGWPLGDMGAEPDPINGYVFTTQTKPNSGPIDTLAIKKSDGTTKWLGTGIHDRIMGYDSKENLLILRRSDGSSNKVVSYNMTDSSVATISSSFAAGKNSWQAGGTGAVDTYGRTAYVFNGTTLYKINLDDGTESSVTLSSTPTSVAWDNKGQKLYVVYSNKIGTINTSTGVISQISSDNAVNGMANYVQTIAPNDQRYYINTADSKISVYSLTDGSLLGSFDSILRIMPVGATILGDETTDQTISTDIADPSSLLIKLGNNTVTYTGTSVSSGVTSIDDGKLVVNGSLENSTSKIAVGATLEGTGTIGGIDSSGTVAPGNSIGTLNVSGDVTLRSSSVLVIEVDANGNSDKIVATGSVSAAGTIKIIPEAGSNYDGASYTFITGSSISGTFSTTQIETCSGTGEITYGVSSITVTLSNCSDSSSTKNYSAVSSYFNDLDSSGDMATIKSAIKSLSGDSYTGAIKALDYNTVGAINKVSLKHSDFAKNIISQRVAISSSNNSPTMNKVSYIDQSNDKSLFNFKQMFSNLKGVDGWWSKFYGGTTERDTDKFIGNNGYDDDYYGMVFGLDGKQDNKITGITLSVQEGNIQGNSAEGDTDYTSFNVSPYLALKNNDGSGYKIQTNVQVIDVSSERFLKFGSINRIAKSNYTNYSIGANFEYSFKTLSFSTLNIDSKINVSYQYNHQESFTEKGADSLNIHVKKNDYQFASVGFSELITTQKNNEFKPFVSVLGSYNSYLGDTDSKQNFQNQTSSYITKIDKNNWMSGTIKTGFVKQSDNKESYLVVGYTRSYKEKDLYLQLGVDIKF